MTARYLRLLALTLCLHGCLAGTLLADTVIVNEDFESYTPFTEGSDGSEQQAFWDVWEPTLGSGNAATDVDQGEWSYVFNGGSLPQFAIDEGYEDAFQDGLGGSQAADLICCSVSGTRLDHQYKTPLGSDGSGAAIVPTATQSIFLSADIFDLNATGNKRATVGLRNRTTTENILELGHYNSSGTSYQYRAILFDPAGDNPNWAGIELDPSLDTTDPPDDPIVINPADIGEGWHRYTATITPTTITITMDLFRNGINEVTEEPGVDFETTINAITTSAGFDSLRFGGPSGLPVNFPVLYDNIMLSLIDVDAGGLSGDYNGDGLVDAADYTIWRDTFNQSVTAGEGADGNGDGFIDNADYTVWVSNYGQTSAPATASAAVPEPTTFGLLASVLAAGLARARRS